MDSQHSRRWRRIAMPLGLVLTASLGLAGAAVASGQDAPASSTKDGEKFSYVVNTEADAGTVKRVKKEIAKADGKVVTAYGKIGVIVAHSSNAKFAETMRSVKGVETAGATRTAPLKSAATTDVGKPKFLDVPKSATGAQAKAKALEEGEEIELQFATLDDAITMIRRGEIHDGKTIATLLMYDKFFRNAGGEQPATEE